MNNKIIAALLTTLITGYFGYKGARYANSNNYRTTLFKQQLYDVFLPMFKIIEDTMYQELDIDEARNISFNLKRIACLHMELIDPYMYKSIIEFDSDISKGIFNYDDYSSLCYSIDKEYERLKKKLKLPKRGILYKYTYKQMPKDKWKEFNSYFNTFVNFIGKLILLLISTTFIYAIYSLIKSALGFFNLQLP